MSKCIITVKVNGEELKLNLNDSSPSVLIDESFIQALREDPEALNKIVEGIRAQSINSGLRSIKLKDLQQEGIQANCTLQYLRESPEFGEIQFPDGNANILLVNKLSIGGKPIYGRTINSNGEEVFVVKGTKEDVQKLSNFLKIRNTIRDYGLNVSEESPYYQELNEILQESKQKNQEIGSLEDMLVDYVSNKKAYSFATSFKASNLPDAPPCPASMLISNNNGALLVLNALNFAIHLAGSQYCTWESWSPVVTNIWGYSCGLTLSQGE